MFRSSRNVDAARKVSAVCLEIYQNDRPEYGYVLSLLCNLVGLDGSISPFKRFEAELFHVCLSSSIVYYGIVVRIFTLRLPQFVSIR